MRLFDGVQLAFGPTIENGFYYDFEAAAHAVRGGFPGDRGRDGQDRQGGRAVRAGRRAARRGAGNSAATWAKTLKVEHIETGWPTTPALSFYRQGEFIDLCRGPHVPAAGAIGAFKLLIVAGAYWKGDAIAAAVAAALRHRLVQQAGLGELSRHGRRGQAPRPSRAGQAARTVHHRLRSSARA